MFRALGFGFKVQGLGSWGLLLGACKMFGAGLTYQFFVGNKGISSHTTYSFLPFSELRTSKFRV